MILVVFHCLFGVGWMISHIDLQISQVKASMEKEIRERLQTENFEAEVKVRLEEE